MDTKLSIQGAANYSSLSQIIRIASESWVSKSIYCPNCGNRLTKFMNNKPVADFYCPICFEEYELKSKHGNVGKKIVNGAYSTLIERISANNNPNFFFLLYDKSNFGIKDFLTIPKYFFVPEVIERRKPLNLTARRAGWIGCNIVLNGIPEFGKIFYIKNGVEKSKDEVLLKWSRTEFIRKSYDIDVKGWILDVLLCLEKINKKEFSLEEVYAFEIFLKNKHPLNNNIKAKIRQQLQFLRDRNVFIGHGIYRFND